MAENTGISWTDSTFNPWMGCTNVTIECDNCYALTLTRNKMKIKVWGKNPRQITSPTNWKKPIRWNKAAKLSGEEHKVFSGSLCDIFEDHPQLNGDIRVAFWTLVKNTPYLTWQILTKRPENISGMLPSDWGMDHYRHVWLGTTVGHPDNLWRLDHLRKIDASVRFISYEPALGPLAPTIDLDGFDWLVYGGEAGPGFRDHDLQWARDMRVKCKEEKVAFYYKQSPGYRTGLGTTLDGETYHQFPGTGYNRGSSKGKRRKPLKQRALGL